MHRIMSTALVSSTFYDFGDHVAYRANNASTTLAHKNNYVTNVERKSGVFGAGQPASSQTPSSGHHQLQSSMQSSTNPVNVGSRRLVSASVSVPLGVGVHPQSSSISIPAFDQKSATSHGLTMANAPVTLVSALSNVSVNGINNNNSNNNNILLNNNNNLITAKEHKKLDRSLSEPVEKSSAASQQQVLRAANQANSSRYKTELCRPFEENGTCKYGDKCQFAHGSHELRTLTRHPKYKTELCRTFHTTGFCPYGPRCHFIHNSEETKKNLLNNLAGLQPNTLGGHRNANEMIGHNGNAAGVHSGISIGNGVGAPTYQSNSVPLRPKALSIGSYSLGSSGEISPPSSQSGSPTSLHSFFADEGFNPFISPATVHSAGTGQTAFSFSPDFASLVAPCTQSKNVNVNGVNFDNLHSTLGQRSVGGNLINGSDMGTDRGVSIFSCFQNQQQAPALCNQTAVGRQPTGMTTPPPVKSVTAKYPAAPASPVESLASDVDALSLGGSSPIPTCSSPLEVSRNLPRLPIFTRFANNGNNCNDSE